MKHSFIQGALDKIWVGADNYSIDVAFLAEMTGFVKQELEQEGVVEAKESTVKHILVEAIATEYGEYLQVVDNKVTLCLPVKEVING